MIRFLIFISCVFVVINDIYAEPDLVLNTNVLQLLMQEALGQDCMFLPMILMKPTHQLRSVNYGLKK